MKIQTRLLVTQVTLTPGKENVTFQVQYALIDEAGKEVLFLALPYGSVSKDVSADVAPLFTVGAIFTS